MIGNNLRKNNQTIALDVFYTKKEKCNSNCEKEVILLMISSRKGSYDLSVKKLSTLERDDP